MGMKIEYALDWQDVSSKLLSEMQSAGYNPDLKKMYNNISSMVTELSKLEVLARRSQKYSFTTEKVENINKAINHLEKLILIAKLMK
jgi:hypothetical protein